MGVIHRQMVVCITYDYNSNNLTELDDLVDQNPKLFAKSLELINGIINYVMFWDGSKEEWGDSIEGDKLREKFFKAIKKLEHAHIYEISDHEADEPRLYYSKVSNRLSSPRSET